MIMQHYTIINSFIGKNVEVTTSAGKTFAGTLSFNLQQMQVIITPVDENTVAHFGPVSICQTAVVAIREVLVSQGQ